MKYNFLEIFLQILETLERTRKSRGTISIALRSIGANITKVFERMALELSSFNKLLF